MNVIDYTLVIRHLRGYYNEVVAVINALEEEEITLSESEKELIALDNKYAQIIVEELGNPT